MLSKIERCDVVEMRKNLGIVEQFKKVGIDFVAIPVFDKEEKEKYVKILKKKLESL